MSAIPDDSSMDSTTPSERLLRTQIAELETEVAELREAAAHARELVVRAGAERLGLQAELDDLRRRVRDLSSVRGSLRALQQATVRRVRH